MKKKKSKKKPVKEIKTSQSPPPANEPDPLDFGGLPKRDLKKNLGCG